MSDDSELRACAQRIERLLGDVEAVAGPLAWTRVQALVTALVELYGAGLERMLAHALETARDRGELGDRLGRDEVVGSLLALHDIHPISIEERVERGLARARAQLSGGATIELEKIEDGVASVRASGAESGSGGVLGQLVARAVEHEAPEIAKVSLEGVAPAKPPDNIVSVERIVRKARA